MKKLLSLLVIMTACLSSACAQGYQSLPEGKPAPDFTLVDTKGKQVSLKSLQGKWVVLDFWGSWCGWCIKGFPQMKESHKALGDQVTFVGIDCRDSKETWLAAVEKYELPWLNLWAGEDYKELCVKYMIAGFPTKLILDPKGNVRNVTVGEDPAFYDTLRALLSK